MTAAGSPELNALSGRRHEVGRHKDDPARADARPISHQLADATEPVRTALRQRTLAVLDALDVDGTAADSAQHLLDLLAEAIGDGPIAERAWLTLAVLNAQLPDPATVQRFVRTSQFDGSAAAIELDCIKPLLADPSAALRDVRVVTDCVVVDIQRAGRGAVAAGARRIAREVAVQWHRTHGARVVEWHPTWPALRELDDPGATFGADIDTSGRSLTVVPYRCKYVVAGPLTDVDDSAQLHALLRFSGCESSAIGYDCLPLTAAESVPDELGNGFAAGLAAVAHVSSIAATSESSAREYRGWRSMLAGTGLSGPEIVTVSLPLTAGETSPSALEMMRRELLIGRLDMVLCVGTHEPRKNYLAVLHAAELLWREGQRFSLVFIGSDLECETSVAERIHALQGANRPVHSAGVVTDEQLWSAYRLAHCTLYAATNDGLALPVSESLACGTPVITSNFGHMREVAERGGALLVDPWDDHDIAGALRRVLSDTETYQLLANQARSRQRGSWDNYAARVWQAVVYPGAPEDLNDT